MVTDYTVNSGINRNKFSSIDSDIEVLIYSLNFASTFFS